MWAQQILKNFTALNSVCADFFLICYNEKKLTVFDFFDIRETIAICFFFSIFVKQLQVLFANGVALGIAYKFLF